MPLHLSRELPRIEVIGKSASPNPTTLNHVQLETARIWHDGGMPFALNMGQGNAFAIMRDVRIKCRIMVSVGNMEHA